MNASWNICLDCSDEMVVDEENSELVCQSFGVVKRLVGIAFNEAHFFKPRRAKQEILSINSVVPTSQSTSSVFCLLSFNQISLKDGHENKKIFY